MKKVLSFIVQEKKVIVTGDSNRNTFNVNDQHFEIGEPYLIDFVTPEGRTEFFQKLLQENHQYTLHPDMIVIDEIVYYIKGYELESMTSKRNHIFPSRMARNLFNEYKGFLSFHIDELRLSDMEKNVEKFLNQFNIDKAVANIEKNDDGFKITVSNYSYTDQTYPNFNLFLSTSNKLKFLHFLEEEGEIYHSGDEPITRHDIERRVKRQQNLLIKFDELTKLFDITL